MPPTGPIPLSDPLLGTMVGEYRVEAVIGEGGMGVVYRGAHPIIGKLVAIKVLKASLAKHKGLTQRLIEEARAVNAVGHRNIIDIFGLGELPDHRPYIIMEHLAGDPLDAVLLREGRLSEQAAIALTLELCQPLEAAHRAGVIHRDLKPGNVFLCDQADGPRFLKLLDFGLARRTGGFGASTAQTNRAFIVGTPNYLSPEQASGGDISDRTDVYALGVMLFEFLTATVPFTGNNAIEVAMAHVSQPPPRVTELEPSVSPLVADLIARMLSKRPDARPGVEEVRRLLAPNAPARVARPPKESESGRVERPLTVQLLRPPPSPGLRAWAVLGGLLVLGALGTFWALRPSAPLPVMVLPPPRPVEVPVVVPEPIDAGALAVVVLPPPRPVEVPVVASQPVDAGVAPVITPVPVRVPHARVEPARPVPTVAELTRRVATLESQLRASTPRGEEADPAALRLLGSYRLKAELASTPAERLEVARKLELWQRTHP